MTQPHIFRAASQPATHYRIADPRPGHEGKWFWITNGNRRPIFCRTCKQRHWAQYMVAQDYFDGTYFFCADGHGCKGAK